MFRRYGYLLWLLVSFGYVVVGYFQQELNYRADDVPLLKLGDLVPPNYDKLKPPKINGGPVVVSIKLSVLVMRNVDAEKLSYEMDVFFHQVWTDRRLHLPQGYNQSKVVIDGKWRNDIWAPDTFFKNSQDGKLHNIIIPYLYMTLNNNSEIFQASRLTLKLNCEMDLFYYPHDQQLCDVMIMSLQNTNDTVVLEWKEFELTKNILLPQFKVTGSGTNDCTKSYKIGHFSCLQGWIQLQRRQGYFVINRFVPSLLVVLMSFVSFWIPPTAYPARVSLSVTSILTIVTQQYQSSLPSVSYIMALNVWIMGCIAFVFFTLLEYCIIIAMIAHGSGEQLCFSFASIKFFRHKDKAEITQSGDKSSGEKFHLRLDRFSRYFFPMAFFTYVILYYLIFAAKR